MTTKVDVINESVVPAGYDFEFAYSEDCSSWTIGEESDLQYLSLVAEKNGTPITGGSYKLKFNDEVSSCIPFDASKDILESAILSFDSINDVMVHSVPLPLSDQFPFAYAVKINDYPTGDKWTTLSIDQNNFGSGECDAFDGAIMHKAVFFPVKERSLCTRPLLSTQVILLNEMNPEGTFALSYSGKKSHKLSVTCSAQDVIHAMTSLYDRFSTFDVKKRDNYDSVEGSAWIMEYSTIDDNMDEILVDDTHVTGDTIIAIYPVITFRFQADDVDMSGDVRIHFDNEVTNRISIEATNGKYSTELHKLKGISRAEIIGSGSAKISASYQALLDDSLNHELAIPEDITSSVAKGDTVKVVTCDDLRVDSILYETFDASSGAGQIFDSTYSGSARTSVAKSRGYTILGLNLDPSKKITTVCSSPQSDTALIKVGEVTPPSSGGKVIERMIAIKGHSLDLHSFRIVPEQNWRGIRSQIFFFSLYQTRPHQFILGNKPQIQRIIFRDISEDNQRMVSLSFKDASIALLPWPSSDGIASISILQSALENLPPTEGQIDVQLDSVSGYEFVYDVTFYGRYRLNKIPLISSTVTNGGLDSKIEHSVLQIGSTGVASSFAYRAIPFNRMEEAQTEYSVRIAGKNSKGYGVLSPQESISMKAGGSAPDPPRSITLQDQGSNKFLQLQFQPPWNDGGEIISKYLVQCDTSMSFNPDGPNYWRDEMSYKPEIQEVLLSCGSVQANFR
jgi:hypothetical protein